MGGKPCTRSQNSGGGPVSSLGAGVSDSSSLAGGRSPPGWTSSLMVAPVSWVPAGWTVCLAVLLRPTIINDGYDASAAFVDGDGHEAITKPASPTLVSGWCWCARSE